MQYNESPVPNELLQEVISLAKLVSIFPKFYGCSIFHKKFAENIQ